ncbi:hypothetical protein [Amycolatopsis sp. cmx-11-32]|uniref:hypothetical protein n=1 Tax=Amycolatopsis sp. cmx-11-32 TaxID=2785796 RepID=UPI0039E71C12
MPDWKGNAEESEGQDDYDRACAVNALAATVPIGEALGLVLGDDPGHYLLSPGAAHLPPLACCGFRGGPARRVSGRRDAGAGRDRDREGAVPDTGRPHGRRLRVGRPGPAHFREANPSPVDSPERDRGRALRLPTPPRQPGCPRALPLSQLAPIRSSPGSLRKNRASAPPVEPDGYGPSQPSNERPSRNTTGRASGVVPRNAPETAVSSPCG